MSGLGVVRRRVGHRLAVCLSGMLVQLIMAEGSVLCGAGEVCVWVGGARGGGPPVIIWLRERDR